jgi:hypothetical protein
MSTKSTSVFKDREVAETLSTTHDIYAVVPADQAPNNIVPICKKHYVLLHKQKSLRIPKR